MSANGFAQAANGMTARLLLIGFLVGVMLVPMMMVKGTIQERGNYYNEAVSSVGEGWAGSQSLADPVLVLPYSYQRETQRRNEDNTVETVTTQETGQHLFYPERTDVAGDVRSETRRRGLFAVPIYDADIKMTGSFTVPPLAPVDAQRPGLKYGAPFVVLRIKDPRGLHGDYVFGFQARARHNAGEYGRCPYSRGGRSASKWGQAV
jgi:inner membrane protein